MLSQNIVLALRSVLCLRQEVKQHCGVNYKGIRRKEKPLVHWLKYLGLLSLYHYPHPKTMKLFPQVVGKIGWFLKPGVNAFRTTLRELSAATFPRSVHGDQCVFLILVCESVQYFKHCDSESVNHMFLHPLKKGGNVPSFPKQYFLRFPWL